MKTLYTILFISLSNIIFTQQRPISRVNDMPNEPSPYLMRNWKQVAQGYDSLVFKADATGQYLPLIFHTNNPNYSGDSIFGLKTVVGETKSAEAINILPALVGASLIGIDKSHQNEQNYVAQITAFFNKKNGENVYLNNHQTKSGNDWWYDVMPNIFFYQLYHLYPNTPHFKEQFTSVANQWLKAVATMGGNTAPWEKPYMNYRAWKLQNMTPLREGVKQPEAAGGIAWLLYNAYLKTKDKKYRIGAEWCMEFLDGQETNPSYELQLPYGVFTAARMNAEIGTHYDIEKLINWCFNRGELRGWGVVAGNWNGYDAHGLIGEVNDSTTDSDYVFMMNGYQQAAALVPLVKYDDRFAKSIAKWILNLANASRLFYYPYLPTDHQDGNEWSALHDPKGYIGHEAIREKWEEYSPFATGDFVRNTWGQTNLVLYGSSHIGYLASLIDTTNIPEILQIDANKTAFFASDPYPTYLYFNPYNEGQEININLGTEDKTIYDLISNTILQKNVKNLITIHIPADSVFLISLIPSNYSLVKENNKTLANNIVVDYNNGNPSPTILRMKSIAAEQDIIHTGISSNIYCTLNINAEEIVYEWTSENGIIMGSGQTVKFIPADNQSTALLKCKATYEQQTVEDSLLLRIEPYTGIEIPQKTNKRIKIYPNPFHDRLNIGIETKKQQIITIYLYDIQGKQIKKKIERSIKTGKNTIDYNLQNIDPGMYLLSITTEKETQIFKINK